MRGREGIALEEFAKKAALLRAEARLARRVSYDLASRDCTEALRRLVAM